MIRFSMPATIIAILALPCAVSAADLGRNVEAAENRSSETTPTADGSALEILNVSALIARVEFADSLPSFKPLTKPSRSNESMSSKGCLGAPGVMFAKFMSSRSVLPEETGDADEELPDVVDYTDAPSELWHVRPEVRQAWGTTSHE